MFTIRNTQFSHSIKPARQCYGLDMYLNKHTYIGGYFDHRNVTGKISIKIDGKPIQIDLKKVDTITERVGYWRKANAIHKWFVDNVQEGQDDCKEYYVDEEDLKKLLAACKLVKKDPDQASKVLPTQSGFFFGGTEYDEYYFQDIDETIKVCEAVLKEPGEYYYQSSW